MDTGAAARAWVEGWTAGWENADADRIGALYAENAVFRSHPFREPERSAHDWTAVPSSSAIIGRYSPGEPSRTSRPRA